MYKGNPFAKAAPAHYGVEFTQCCCADDRIDMVRRFDIEECQAALAMKVHLQLTVLKAVERRLRKLTRGNSQPATHNPQPTSA